MKFLDQPARLIVFENLPSLLERVYGLGSMQDPSNRSGALRRIDFTGLGDPLRDSRGAELAEILAFLLGQSQDERYGANFQPCDPRLVLLGGSHRQFIGTQNRLRGQPS